MPIASPEKICFQTPFWQGLDLCTRLLTAAWENRINPDRVDYDGIAFILENGTPEGETHRLRASEPDGPWAKFILTIRALRLASATAFVACETTIRGYSPYLDLLDRIRTGWERGSHRGVCFGSSTLALTFAAAREQRTCPTDSPAEIEYFLEIRQDPLDGERLD